MRGLLLACLSWIVRALFRFEVSGRDYLDRCADGAVLVVNHVSFIDGILLCAVKGKRPFCAVDHDVGRVSWVRPVIAQVGHCLVDSAHPFGLRKLVAAGRRGETVAIFPEARITVTGLAMKCYAGACFVARRTGQPVLHVRIDGAERSTFSYIGGMIRQRRLPKIRITYHPPVHPPAIAGRRMQALYLYDLLTAPQRTGFAPNGVPAALERAADRVGADKPALSDNERKPISYRNLSRHLEQKNEDGSGYGDLTAAGAAVSLGLPSTASEKMLQTSAALGTAWDINAGDRVFVACPEGDLLGRTAGLVLPLQRGATVMRYRPRRDTRTLSELLYDFNATVLVTGASALAELAAAHAYDFRSLRMVITWQDHADDVRRLLPGVPVWSAQRAQQDGWPLAVSSPFWTFLPGGYRDLDSIIHPDDGFYVRGETEGVAA
jgi:1-acyl-sn-glycerol-3-phosphate acyltransferase